MRNKKLNIVQQKIDMLIIRLAVGDELHNFILDTTTPFSIISKEIIGRCDHGIATYYCEAEKSMTGRGEMSCLGLLPLRLYIDNDQVCWQFVICDIQATIDAINKEYGILISGILGCDFLQTYKAVINFKNNTIELHV